MFNALKLVELDGQKVEVELDILLAYGILERAFKREIQSDLLQTFVLS